MCRLIDKTDDAFFLLKQDKVIFAKKCNLYDSCSDSFHYYEQIL